MGKYSSDVQFARSDPASLWAAREIGITNLNSSNDTRQIRAFLRSNETPWDKQTRLANERSQDLLNQLKLTQETYSSDMAKLRSGYESTINTIVSDADIRYNNMQDSMNKMLLSQSNAFDAKYAEQQAAFDKQYAAQKSAFDDLTLQYQNINDAYTEQQKKAANLSNASVPAPVQSADVPLAGDAREETGGRMRKNNTLSNLTLLSGLGTSGNPNSGLQLA